MYCVKSVHIRNCSGPYFLAFGPNTERCFLSLRIQLKCGKIRTRKTQNTDTFYAVISSQKLIHTSFCRWINNRLFFSWLAITEDVFRKIRGGSRAAATLKMERFVIIVNGWTPLTITTKRSILDVAAARDPPLINFKGNNKKEIKIYHCKFLLCRPIFLPYKYYKPRNYKN